MLPLILDAATLRAYLGSHTEADVNTSVLIVDLSTEDLYRQGHVPHAVFFKSESLIEGQPPAPGKLPACEKLAQALSEIGYRAEQHVIVYDHQGGPWAGRFIWTLDCIGHTGGVSFLTGGAQVWEAQGNALVQEVPVITATDVSITAYKQAYIADAQYIKKRLSQPDFRVWDARSPEEYSGKKVLAAKGGHIPGAINIEWTQLLASDFTLKSLVELAQIVNDHELSVDDEIVTHCHTHRRSGLTYVVMKALGFPHIKAYPGSWSEWGNLADMPIEN